MSYTPYYKMQVSMALLLLLDILLADIQHSTSPGILMMKSLVLYLLTHPMMNRFIAFPKTAKMWSDVRCTRTEVTW